MAMAPALRKFALTAHIISSVGWFGAVACFLALGITGLVSQDLQLIQAAYRAMEPITWFVFLPLALASLLTGIIQALGTTWGLFKHYWVVFKLLLTVIATGVLVHYLPSMAYIAGPGADTATTLADLRALGASPVLHAGGGLIVLLLITILSVYKPHGLTPWGTRS